MAQTVTVKSGDTLNAIAQAAGFANFREAGITSVPSGNFDLIRPGEEVILTNASGPAPSPQPDEPTVAPPTVGTTTGITGEVIDVGLTKDEAADFDTEEELQEEITRRKEAARGGLEAPELRDREAEFRELRAQEGVSQLETESVTLEGQLDAELANLRAFRAEELGGPGTLGFARGRIGTEERAVQERVDFIQRRLKLVNERLKLKNQNIRDVMNLRELDFEDAKDEYEREFNLNLDILASIAEEDEQELLNEKATYSTLTNMYKDVALDDIPQNVQDRLEILEAQLGLPIGAFAAVRDANPDAKILFHGKSTDAEGNEFAWFVTRDKDGIPQISTLGTGGVSTSERKERETSEDFDKARKFIEDNPDATETELRAGILENTDLTVTEVNSLLGQRLSPTEIEISATDLVLSVWESKALSTSKTELENAKTAAKAKLKVGEVFTFDKKEIRLTQTLVDSLKKQIDDLSDHNALRAEFDKL